MDKDGFAALYLRYSRPFFKVASAQVGPNAAQDVVHDVFEVVWSKRRQAPANPDEWGPWAWGILRNKVRQEIQRTYRKHHDNRFADDFTSDGDGYSVLADVADTIAARDAAMTAWASLSDDDQELLLLVVNTDLPGAEVAALMGISYAAYRRRVSRMRARITGTTTASNQGEEVVKHDETAPRRRN